MLKSLRASLYVEADKRTLSALETALDEQEQDRFSSSIEFKGESITIMIEAKDATALRAVLNSYLRILQAAEKVV